MSGEGRPVDVREQPSRPPLVVDPATLGPAAPSPSPGRRAMSGLGLLALLASAFFGANAFGVRERFLGSETPVVRAPATGRIATSDPAPTATTVAAPETIHRSQPWWQRVGALEGVGRAERSLAIDPGAIQFRAAWSCERGHLAVQVPGGRRPVLDTACPGAGTAYATQTGAVPLEVRADGPWRLEVDQQVDRPLIEPPLPAMTAARKLLVGSFYRIDQTGRGTITVYRLDDGSYALRLEDFYTTPNVDLDIRFSTLEAPRSTEAFMAAASSEKAAPLDITAGSMNFAVPAGIDPTQYRSAVIWCPLIDSAYAAATLGPAS